MKFESHFLGFPLLQFHGAAYALASHCHLARCLAGENGFRLAASVAPGDVERDTASGADAFYRPLGPLVGEGGKQFQGLAVALKQHFAHARRAAEIAINLEGSR